MYVLLIGCGDYWDDGVCKVLGPFESRQEAVDMEKYCERYSNVKTEIFELTKEL